MRIAAVLIALMACSCVDIREEFWIHEDRSATAEITCILPRAATLATGGADGIRSLVERLLAKESCVDSYKVQVTELQKEVTLTIQCTLDDVMDFEKLRDSIKRQEDLPIPVRKMMGEFEIHIDGLSGISVKRTVTPGEALPMLQWLPKSQIEGHRLVNIIHFPYPITNHNADDSWDKGCTLCWDNSLANSLQKPVVYEFVMPLPLPWGSIIAITIGLVALFALGLVLIRIKLRSKRNREFNRER